MREYCNCSRCNGDGPEEDIEAEWITENTTYEMSCCGKTVDIDDLIFNDDGSIQPRRCDECSYFNGEDTIESVNEVIPDYPEPDYDEPYEEPEYEPL